MNEEESIIDRLSGQLADIDVTKTDIVRKPVFRMVALQLMIPDKYDQKAYMDGRAHLPVIQITFYDETGKYIKEQGSLDINYSADKLLKTFLFKRPEYPKDEGVDIDWVI